MGQPQCGRRRLPSPVAVACAAALGAVLANCGGTGATAPPSLVAPTIGPTVAATAPAAPTTLPSATPTTFIKTTIKFEQSSNGVYSLAGAGTTLWVEGDDGGAPRLHRVDTVTNEVVGSLDGFAPQIVDLDLWYADPDGKDLIRANVETGEELERVAPPHLGVWAKVDETFWIATEAGNKLTRWDGSTGNVVSEIELPPGEPKDVIEAGGAIWVAVDGANVLVRIDPATDTIVEEIPVGSRPHTLAAGFGSVWVVNRGEASVARVDLETNAVTKIRDVGINVGIAMLEGELLLVTTPAGLATIDTDANRVKRAYEWAPGEYYALAIVNGLWVSDVDNRAIYRIDFGPGTPGPVDP